MADRAALGMIGYLMGGITALIMLIGATVVNASLSSETASSGEYEITLSAKAR